MADAFDHMYETEERVTVAEVPGLRVRRLRLGAGGCVPWHHHTQVTDTFFCMEGPMQVTTRSPEGSRGKHVLVAGGTCSVPPLTDHLVTGVDDGPCAFLVIQGIGVYDYVATAAP